MCTLGGISGAEYSWATRAILSWLAHDYARNPFTVSGDPAIGSLLTNFSGKIRVVAATYQHSVRFYKRSHAVNWRFIANMFVLFKFDVLCTCLLENRQTVRIPSFEFDVNNCEKRQGCG